MTVTKTIMCNTSSFLFNADILRLFFFSDLPTSFYTLNISKCATWNPTGITVAGNTNGTNGSGLGSLSSPVGIFIDNNNSLFIADRNNYRIMKYNVNDTQGTLVAGGFGAGNGFNQLNEPKGVAVDPYGFLIVGDSSNHRIQNFSNSSYGTTIAESNSITPFANMLDLHIDNYNNVYVTDGSSAQITKSNLYNQTDILFSSFNGNGSAANQFNSPSGNFIDINQAWYIADTHNHRVQKWFFRETTGTTVAGITGSAGSNMSQLNNPVAVVVDNNGYVFK
jgi:sugar lactone lactonase YvrE